MTDRPNFFQPFGRVDRVGVTIGMRLPADHWAHDLPDDGVAALAGLTVETEMLGAPVSGRIVEAERYDDDFFGPGIWVLIAKDVS